MGSTFFGLNIAVKGLQAQQMALDVTSHNIANANTVGYTRQDVIMETTLPIKTYQGFVGTGVDIGEIRRIRDEFLDIQMRTENKSLGEWDVKADILGKLEVIINEPSESGLCTVMDEYWESWQQLSKDPESTAVRSTVMQSGLALTDAFNHMDRQYDDLQADINRVIAVKAEEINSIGQQLKDLNYQIMKAEADGTKANDLRDKRDLLVEQLSKIVDIQVVEDQFSSLNVTIGGRSLVNRTNLGEIRFTNNELDPTAAKLEWIEPLTGEVQGNLQVKGGELKGYLDVRDVIVVGIKEKISELANTIAEEVNAAHVLGMDLSGAAGGDFFASNDGVSPITAGNITVNPAIVNDVTMIAAGKTAFQGDGSNALAIAQLKNKFVLNSDTATFDDYYNLIVAQLGVDALEAERMRDNQTLLTEQIENKRQGISGVSLDEEMANMIKYQHAYTAAARMVNVMDEMLDLIVNRLGTAGR